MQPTARRRGGIPSALPLPGSRGPYRFVLLALSFLVVLSWFSFSDLLRGLTMPSPSERTSEVWGEQLLASTGSSAAALPHNQRTDAISSVIDDSFKFRLITEDTRTRTSAAHCSLSTMNDKVWEAAMCSFKSLCYHPDTEQFTFHRALPEIAVPPHAVNLGKRTKFYPTVVDAPLPLPRYEASEDETWVITELDESALKLEDFLRDDLFAWWMLVQHTPWSDLRTKIRPLAVVANVEMNQQMNQWFQAMPFEQLTTLKKLTEKLGGHPICFPRAVAGTGAMTDHCQAPDHDFHELKKPSMGVGVEAIPCATGRGPLFYRIREEMIATLTHKSQNEHSKHVKMEEMIILLAEESSTATEYEGLEKLLSVNLPEVRARRVCTSCLTPKEQMELALTIAVYVTKPTGAQSMAAHFLRKGAGVVLFEDGERTHTNFGLWNNLAYLRARWVREYTELVQDIQIELEKCREFM